MNRVNHLCMKLGPIGIRLMSTSFPHTEGHPVFFVIQRWQAEEFAAARRWIKKCPRVFWYRRVL